MDFKRIQVVLILFFLIFDGYLSFRVYQQIQATVVRQSDYQQASIEQRLSVRGVTLLTELSDTQSEGYLVKNESNTVLDDTQSDLAFVSTEYDELEQLNVVLDTPIDLSDYINETTSRLSDEAIVYLQQNVLSDASLVIRGEEYVQFMYSPVDLTIVVRMTILNEMPIVDGTGEIVFHLNQQYEIESYTQTYQDEFTVLDEQSPYKLISQKDALEVLDTRIDTNIPSNSEIVAIELSYVRYKEWDHIAIYLPVWNVLFQRSEGQMETMTVDAIKGQVMVY